MVGCALAALVAVSLASELPSGAVVHVGVGVDAVTTEFAPGPALTTRLGYQVGARTGVGGNALLWGRATPGPALGFSAGPGFFWNSVRVRAEVGPHLGLRVDETGWYPLIGGRLGTGVRVAEAPGARAWWLELSGAVFASGGEIVSQASVGVTWAPALSLRDRRASAGRGDAGGPRRRPVNARTTR